MRKIALLLLLVLIIGGVGGSYWFWKQQAAKVEQLVKNDIDAINKSMIVLLDGKQAIQYEGFEVSGWPLQIRITLIKPALYIPVSNILATMRAARSPMPLPDRSDLNWIERMEMPDGRLSVVSNLTASHFDIRFEKGQLFTTIVNGKEEGQRRVTYGSPLECSIDFNHGFVKTPLPQTANDMLREFHAFDCSVSALKVTDQQGQKLYSSLDAMTLHASTQAGAQDMRSFDLAMNLQNAYSTPDMDAQMALYSKLAMRAQGFPENLPYNTIPASAYGHQNMAVDFHYYGPESPSANLAALPIMQIDLNRFEITNDLFTASMVFHLSNAKAEGDMYTASLDLKSKSKFTPKFDELKLKQLQSFVAYIFSQQGAVGDSFKKSVDTLKPEEFNTLLSDLYPHFSELGEVVFEANGKVTADRQFTNGAVNINRLAFTTTPYGISLNSIVNMKDHGVGDAELTIVCQSCGTLLDKLTAYTIMINRYAQRLYPEDVKEYITLQLAGTIRGFLAELAKTADIRPEGIRGEQDWVYHAVMRQGQMTLNTKPMMQVFSEFMAQIGPYMPSFSEEKGNSDNTAAPSKYQPTPPAAMPSRNGSVAKPRH